MAPTVLCDALWNTKLWGMQASEIFRSFGIMVLFQTAFEDMRRVPALVALHRSSTTPCNVAQNPNRYQDALLRRCSWFHSMRSLQMVRADPRMSRIRDNSRDGCGTELLSAQTSFACKLCGGRAGVPVGRGNVFLS
eukprot:5761889-Amphidinium_carterae.1